MNNSVGKKKQTKSVGAQIALRFYPEGTMDHAVQAVKLSRLINAALKRAVEEAWWTATNAGTYSKEEIEAMYGIRKL